MARRNQLPTSRKVGFGETTPVRSRQLRALLDAPLSLHDVRKDIVDSRQMARSLGLQPFQHVAPDEPVDLLAKPSQRFCAVRLNLRAGLNLPLPEFVPFASEPAFSQSAPSNPPGRCPIKYRRVRPASRGEGNSPHIGAAYWPPLPSSIAPFGAPRGSGFTVTGWV